MESKIKCPKCNWKPDYKDRWQCACLHVWNTFETGGTCPNCKKRWEDTQCLNCKKWSPHLDWYSNYEKLLKEEIENIKIELDS